MRTSSVRQPQGVNALVVKCSSIVAGLPQNRQVLAFLGINDLQYSQVLESSGAASA
jgi:hypothetical protein